MPDETTEKRRGRPPKPLGDAARGPLTIRLRAEVRRDVERAAIRYGRSLSEEIESRLEVSFAFTQYVRHEWGDDIFRIAQAMAGSLSFLEDWTGESWIGDKETYDLLQLTVANIIRNYRDLINKADGRAWPQGGLNGKTPDELGQMFAAMGGLAPPRPKKPVPPPEPSNEQHEGRQRSMANMRKILAEKSPADDGET